MLFLDYITNVVEYLFIHYSGLISHCCKMYPMQFWKLYSISVCVKKLSALLLQWKQKYRTHFGFNLLWLLNSMIISTIFSLFSNAVFSKPGCVRVCNRFLTAIVTGRHKLTRSKQRFSASVPQEFLKTCNIWPLFSLSFLF